MALTSLIQSFQKCSLVGQLVVKPLLKNEITKTGVLKDFVRFVGRGNKYAYVKGTPGYYRRRVDFPEEYTPIPLKIRKLGGRDPETGRVMSACIGGGQKQRYRWVVHRRSLQPDEPDIVERVIAVRYDPMRTGNIALVGHDDTVRWIIATENMKAGDLIRTSSEIPRIPVRGNEGDCYPLAALPVGSIVNNVEFEPNVGGYFARGAGTSCKLLRKLNGRAILQIPSKHEISVDEKCTAVIGRISKINHRDRKLGTPQQNRYLGNRPRSGLWHRKDGYCGRKIRPLPPLKVFDKLQRKKEAPVYKLS